MSVLLLIEKIRKKCILIYRKNLFRAITGNDVSSLKILGRIDVVNKNVKIGKNVTLFNGVTLFGDGEIVIGDRVSIGENTIIYSSRVGGVKIGSNVQIAAQSYIIDTDHGIKAGILIRDQDNTSQQITIGNDVWIAAGVKVLKGSVLKDGCVIGAQSVVKGVIPENAIAVGIPAKIIKYRE